MKNKTLRSTSRLSVLGVLVLMSGTLAAACQGTERRELGYTDRDLGADRREGPEPTEPFASPADEFLGRWVGTAEDPLGLGDDTYTFPSGSDRFTLEISVIFSEEYQFDMLDTRLTFGGGEPLAPPTDPELGYPVGFSYTDLLTYGEPVPYMGNPDERLPPFEGFTYVTNTNSQIGTEQITVPDGALILSFNVAQALAPWCELQTPHEVPGTPGLYQCQELFGGQMEIRPDGTGARCGLWGTLDLSTCPEDPSDPAWGACADPGEPVATANCDKLYICSNNLCQCGLFGCFAPLEEPDRLMLRRDGDDLIGVFAGTTFLNARNMKTPLGAVRFRRVE